MGDFVQLPDTEEWIDLAIVGSDKTPHRCFSMIFSRLPGILDLDNVSDGNHTRLGDHRVPINDNGIVMINDRKNPNTRFREAHFDAYRMGGTHTVNVYPRGGLKGFEVGEATLFGEAVPELSEIGSVAGFAVHFTKIAVGAELVASNGQPTQTLSRLTATALALTALPKALAS